MKKKILSGIMAVLMMLSLGTGCDDTLDSSTLAEYDRDSKVMADIKENQKQAKDALKTFDDRINSTQDKGESQAEPSQDEGGSQTDLSDEELKELGKIVEKMHMLSIVILLLMALGFRRISLCLLKSEKSMPRKSILKNCRKTLQKKHQTSIRAIGQLLQ